MFTDDESYELPSDEANYSYLNSGIRLIILHSTSVVMGSKACEERGPAWSTARKTILADIGNKTFIKQNTNSQSFDVPNPFKYSAVVTSFVQK